MAGERESSTVTGAAGRSAPGPAGSVGLRPVEPGDEPFLLEVYASSREEEMALVGWTQAQQAAFIDMQFRAQATDYARRFPGAQHSIVLLDGDPVGRVWVNGSSEELRLLDITLLRRSRGRGVGTVVLRGLQEAAVAAAVPLRHTVLTSNVAARRLYERLGFVKIDATATHILMEWRAPAA